MKINIEGNKVEGVFLKRVNRFIAEVSIDGRTEVVHVANTGRMKELLLPGARVVLRKVDAVHRKTQYDLLMVYKGEALVAIDSKLPNRILFEAFQNKIIPHFQEFDQVKQEVTYGKSRFDLSLTTQGKAALIEAKCVTLVREDQVASFPDAPTDRGRKHVLELIEAQKEGFRGAVFFIVQRADASRFTPNKEMDPLFYEAVCHAAREGVEFYAYNCAVTPDAIMLKDPLEVFLNK